MSKKIGEVAKAIRDECQKQNYLTSIPGDSCLWVNLARAAITDMRVPVAWMVEVGEKSSGSNGEVIDVEVIWQAMIDEVLK